MTSSFSSLGLLIVLGFVVAIATPRRWGGVLAFFFGLALLLVWTAVERDMAHPSRRFLWSFATAAIPSMAGIVLGRTLRCIVIGLAGFDEPADTRASSRVLRHLLAACLGMLVPVYIAILWSSFRGASGAVTVACWAAATIAALAAGIGQWRKQESGSMEPLQTSSLAFALSALIVTGWSLATARDVYGTAVAEARGQPFCIQVKKSGGGFRPAKGWLDLSPFTMRADDASGRAFERHAYLVVQRPHEIWVGYWSYGANTFVAVEPGKPDAGIKALRSQIVCKPMPGGFDA